MDASVDDPCAFFAGDFSDLVSAQRIGSVNADADDVSAVDGGGVQLFEGLVHDNGISEFGRSCASQYEEPAWGDDSGSKGKITRIYEVYCQMKLLSGKPDKW